jgi:hypothetical protein
VNGVARRLARLRDFRWDLYAQPLRETRLEMRIVHFAVQMPFACGLTLRVPWLTTIKLLPSPEQPSQADGEQAHR